MTGRCRQQISHQKRRGGAALSSGMLEIRTAIWRMHSARETEAMHALFMFFHCLLQHECVAKSKSGINVDFVAAL